jgi:ABC-2 type transport system permease protein
VADRLPVQRLRLAGGHAWLGFLAQWNPVSATAAACRELFGNPSGITDGVLAENAVVAALAWPLVLAAVFIPLSARAYRRLSS